MQSERAVGLTAVAKSSVSSGHPDEVVGAVVEVGAGAGRAMEASVISAMALSLQACILTMLIRNSCWADCSGKDSWACAKCLSQDNVGAYHEDIKSIPEDLGKKHRKHMFCIALLFLGYVYTYIYIYLSLAGVWALEHALRLACCCRSSLMMLPGTGRWCREAAVSRLAWRERERERERHANMGYSIRMCKTQVWNAHVWIQAGAKMCNVRCRS